MIAGVCGGLGQFFGIASIWFRVAFLIALVEMIMRLEQIIYAPFYALFLVGPAAFVLEMWLDSRREKKLAVANA